MFQSDISRENDEAEVHAQDDDRYSFVQISFREYLAACAIAGMSDDAERLNLARRHALHVAWEQVFILVVSRLDANGQASEADSLIQELNAADTLNVPALGGRDPTHLALRLASRCAAARRKQSPAPGKQPPAPVSKALRAAWWGLWRQEERRYGGVSEGMIVLLTLQSKSDTHLVPSGAPPSARGWPSRAPVAVGPTTAVFPLSLWELA